MNIKLKQIGIVYDSDIVLDGLTIITGKNNSGKTTIGKALYSILDAVSDIQQKYQADKVFYIKTRLDEVRSILDFFRMFSIIREEENPLFGEYPQIKRLFEREYRRGIAQDFIEEYAHDLLSELNDLDVQSIINNKQLLLLYKHLEKSRVLSLINSISEQKTEAIKILQMMFSTLQSIEATDYIRESINQTLQIEFAGQIQPVRQAKGESSLELYENDSVYFKFRIKDNKIIKDENPVYFSSPIKRAFLIDDPFVIDENTYSRRLIHGQGEHEIETILNPNRIISHNEKLISSLKATRPLTVLEQTALEDAVRSIKEQIDSIIPGSFEFTSNGEFYIQDGLKLKVSNLATGSKMYSIIKILLEKGLLDSSTMLILDEPEAHLHPQWQNAFAETIAMLVKKQDINVLLTTHSPNFVLALDAFMRKYGIQEKTNFYQTHAREDGLIDYVCANDNLGVIYQDFTNYLSEMKMLRDHYLYGIEE